MSDIDQPIPADPTQPGPPFVPAVPVPAVNTGIAPPIPAVPAPAVNIEELPKPPPSKPAPSIFGRQPQGQTAPPKPKAQFKPSSVFGVKARTLAAPGSISVPGLQVGALILGVHIPGGLIWSAGGLETSVTKADEVQQSTANGPNDVVLIIVRVPNGD
jgi:hypothetical protein